MVMTATGLSRLLHRRAMTLASMQQQRDMSESLWLVAKGVRLLFVFGRDLVEQVCAEERW
jgi:hypothetical protein